MSRSRKKESRWAPFVVFGGILAIGLTTTTIVVVNNCNRDEPYLDSIRIEWDPTHIKPIPEPIRQSERPLLEDEVELEPDP